MPDFALNVELSRIGFALDAQNAVRNHVATATSIRYSVNNDCIETAYKLSVAFSRH